jgi:alkanesulfonate monooxygenase SsuD/methylene tetrahydromethanopterin reductase-like flavin-dependent oxidoreductase (luciferase family)
MGLPFGFASHFAPAALRQAVALYRANFQPSAQLDRPYVIAGVNVVAADSEAEARAQLVRVQRLRVSVLLGGGRSFTDAEADQVLASPQGRFLAEMMHYAAVGTPQAVKVYLDEFAAHAGADELILALGSPTTGGRLRAVDLVAGECLA